MIPDFDPQGNLPPGIHVCTLDEVVARCGQGSPERQVETTELIQFVQWARQAGVKRLLVDGSYITDKVSPNDADLVVLPGPGYPLQGGSITTSVAQWPFLHIMIAVDESDLQQWAVVDFGTDRMGNPRGILEIQL
jgi:hypothetical protein